MTGDDAEYCITSEPSRDMIWASVFFTASALVSGEIFEALYSGTYFVLAPCLVILVILAWATWSSWRRYKRPIRFTISAEQLTVSDGRNEVVISPREIKGVRQTAWGAGETATGAIMIIMTSGKRIFLPELGQSRSRTIRWLELHGISMSNGWTKRDWLIIGLCLAVCLSIVIALFASGVDIHNG